MLTSDESNNLWSKPSSARAQTVQIALETMAGKDRVSSYVLKETSALCGVTYNERHINLHLIPMRSHDAQGYKSLNGDLSGVLTRIR